MSRCFPFPPPGYEKKARTDEVDLLKKEKNREKKHKKEKKNREKREDKEKRENDRSDGKNRDKKEKKEKNRDRKEKDRDKDKEKSSTSDEKRPTVQSERNNGDKTLDEKKIPGKSLVNSGEILIQKGKERESDRNNILGEKKLVSGYCERISQNSHLAEQLRESKLVHDVGRKVRDESRGTGYQLLEKFTSTDARKDEGIVRLVANASGILAEGKEKNTSIDNRKWDGQGIGEGSRFAENVMAQSFPGIVPARIDRTPKSLEKDIEKRIERKEKSKQKEGDGHGDKRKDKDHEKDGQWKDKNRDKEKKKEEKAKEKSKHKIAGPDKVKESKKGDLTGIQNSKSSLLPKEGTKSVVTEGNIRKRKDPDTNGFLSVNDLKPSKLLRPTPSHTPTQNGKILETPQISGPIISGRQGTVNNLKLDAKERKINGIIEAQAASISSTAKLPSVSSAKGLLTTATAPPSSVSTTTPLLTTTTTVSLSPSISTTKPLLTSTTTPPPSVSKTKPVTTTAQSDEIAEISKKLPHPDSKFLDEVLKVPKMEEWSDFDDQEWLFHGNDSQRKRPKLGSFGIDETPRVWSVALRIESADVCALPYVIPY